MIKGFLAIGIFALCACAQTPEASLRRDFDFGYHVINEKGARVVMAFSDDEKTYFKLFDHPKSHSEITVKDDDGRSFSVSGVSRNLFVIEGTPRRFFVQVGEARSVLERANDEMPTLYAD